MDDVARSAGVSRSLVSLVMRGSEKVSQERRERVLAAAARLGYRPNAVARSLASRRTRTVGVLLGDLRDPALPDVVAGIDEGAAALGYRVLLAAPGRRGGLEALLEDHADGLLLLGAPLRPEALAAAARTTPLVLVGDGPGADGADRVTADDERGARLAVEHLVALGHERIALLDGGAGAADAARRSGYEAAMRAAGLARRRRVLPGADGRSLPRGAGRPTAILAADDAIAAGVLARLGAAGLRVPADMSVVGFGNTALAALAPLSLSSVDLRREALGRLALRLLLERVDGRREPVERRTEPVERRTEPVVVVRRTSGPPA